MTRAVVVGEKNNNFRIVSVPNGLWVLQEWNGAKGTKTVDPWVVIGRPTTRQEALAALKGKDHV